MYIILYHRLYKYIILSSLVQLVFDLGINYSEHVTDNNIFYQQFNLFLARF